MAIKNQSIIIQFTAWDTANNAGKTGDSANFTLKLIQDGTAATPTNSPSEVDATNCPGVYKITLTNDEMNYSTVTLAGKSSSTGIVIIPVHIVTEQGNLATIAGYIDSVESTGVVLAATQGNYPPAKAGDAMTLTSAYDAAKTAAAAGAKMDIVDAPNATGLAAIADAFLKRDWTSVTGEATRSVLNALRPLLNKWTSASGAGGYVVKKEDDSTTAWTGTLTVDENGNISGMDHD